MYEKTPFEVVINAKQNIDEEFPTLELQIEHKPSLKLKETLFFINESAMYATPISKKRVNLIEQKHIYKLAMPTGKNRVKVELLSFANNVAADDTVIENKFKAKPTFHILAVGINEFPNWGKNKYLENAVNDANLIKDTLNQRSNKLFSGKVNIKPYTLDIANTTKGNIENLIQNIRNNIKPNDYFLFYVASHGFIEQSKYYFAPSDFEKLLFAKNMIEENQISDYLINIPTIFRIAILDTCHAGKQVEAIKRGISKLPLGKREGVSVLTAAKTTQKANDKYKGQGLFTYVLAKGLNGSADYNKDSIVDSIEIAQYVKNNVSRVSRAETSIIQDAVVLPNPRESYNRRFELTFLEQKPFRGFQPSVFTPRESALYIDAIQREDTRMMNGLIRNNIRHRHTDNYKSIDSNQLTVQKIIDVLKVSDSVDIDIHFAVNSAKLTKTEIKKLNIIAQALQSNELKSKRILLEGHTDSTGTDLTNMELSQKRADSVAVFLMSSHNMTDERLAPIGFGEIYPIASNETVAGRKKNRRVSIFVYD